MRVTADPMPASGILIRPAAVADDEALWAILEPILRTGETYALPRDWPRTEALAFWSGPPHRVFVAAQDGLVLGTSYLCPNQRGGGAHVANAGFATHPDARGRGIARRLAEHTLDVAREAGFSAMQFNFVVVTNHGAVRLWCSLGFVEVGRLPHAFRHPRLGLVDALVMHRFL